MAERVTERIMAHLVAGYPDEQGALADGEARVQAVAGTGLKSSADCPIMGVMATKKWNLSEIKRRATECGSHWFERGTMRFFASRVDKRVHQGPGGVFFVSSEQFISPRDPAEDGPRKWSVRQFHPSRCTRGMVIEPVGKNMRYPNPETAHKVAARIAQHGRR